MPDVVAKEAVNKEVIKEWVRALRSGEYKQATDALKTENGYCCLGVLCDIQGCEWESAANDFQVDVDYFKVKGEKHNIEVLPESVSRAVGFKLFTSGDSYSTNPSIYLDKPKTIAVYEKYKDGGIDDIVWTLLSELNDSGATFEEIADIIEEQFL